MVIFSRSNGRLLAVVGIFMTSVLAGCGNQQPQDKPSADQVKAFAGDPSKMPQSVKDTIANQQASAAKNAAVAQQADKSRKNGGQ